jgi:hypothetical protein
MLCYFELCYYYLTCPIVILYSYGQNKQQQQHCKNISWQSKVLNTTSGIVLVHVLCVKLFTKACGYVAVTTSIPQSHEIKI